MFTGPEVVVVDVLSRMITPVDGVVLVIFLNAVVNCVVLGLSAKSCSVSLNTL